MRSPSPEDPLAGRYLDLAARQALRAFGRAEPSPLVGAVLVKDARIIGLGHHRRFGGAHAEAEAISDAASRGESPHGSTLYVTLEPCNAPGKQPACSHAVLQAGVARVVYARTDPYPPKAGGAAFLESKGVHATLSSASPLATGVSDPFIKRVTTGLPWVIAKWAQTIDGRIATRTGESKWISSEAARRRVHRLRARVDALLTGIGTVVADDPLLTPRGVPIIRRALRVVADTDLEISQEAALVRTARETPTLVACEASLAGSEIMAARRGVLEHAGVTIIPTPLAKSGRGLDLRALLGTLWTRHQVATVLVEAGPAILGSLFEHDLIDEAVVYVAPMLLGDEMARSVAVGRIAESLRAARRLRLWRSKIVGEEGDVELTYRRLRD